MSEKFAVHYANTTSSAVAVNATATIDPTLPNPSHMRALREIINVLGPERVCDCDLDPHCGLQAEAADALRIAREALGLD